MKVFNTLKAVRALLGISAVRVAEAARRRDGMDVAVEALPDTRVQNCGNPIWIIFAAAGA